MKYVKGVLTTADSNVVLQIPKDWRIQIAARKFMVCVNVAGKDMAYNTNHIISIGELDEQLYNNTITRIAMQREQAQKKADKVAKEAQKEVKKEVKK